MKDPIPHHHRNTIIFTLHFIQLLTSAMMVATMTPKASFIRHTNFKSVVLRTKQFYLLHNYNVRSKIPHLHTCAFQSSFAKNCCQSKQLADTRYRYTNNHLFHSLPMMSSTRKPFPVHRSFLLFHSNTEGDGDPKTSNELLQQILPLGATIQNTLHSSIKLLEEKSIPEPEESVLHLLSHALNLSWENGYRQLRDVLTLPLPQPLVEPLKETTQLPPLHQLSQQILTTEQRSKYLSLLERRMHFEPLQYIIGQWDFHFLTGLKIRKPMLCPRPETEELVELVLVEVEELLRDRELDKKIRILDIGCGTGAIGIAIANRYPNNVEVVGLDVLSEAVDLSNENAGALLSGFADGVDETKELNGLYQAILFPAKDFTNDATYHKETTDLETKMQMNFDIVVSNPPYIPLIDMDGLSTDVVGYESYEALCGGEDGLNVIRDIVHRLPEWTSPNADDNAKPSTGSQSRYCWMEVDDSHPRLMAQWLAPGSEESQRWGVEFCEGFKDFCGRDRFVKLRVL